jgi:hypothetical protein
LTNGFPTGSAKDSTRPLPSLGGDDAGGYSVTARSTWHPAVRFLGRLPDQRRWLVTRFDWCADWGQQSRLIRGKCNPGVTPEKTTSRKLILSACFIWRRERESNPPTRICNPVHNRFAIAPNRSGEMGWLTLASSDCLAENVEREKSLELSTYTLARYRSTN